MWFKQLNLYELETYKKSSQKRTLRQGGEAFGNLWDCEYTFQQVGSCWFCVGL